MKRSLRSYEVRKMREYLANSGIDCNVLKDEDYAVIVNLVRCENYSDTKHSWFDVACHIIKSVIDDVDIWFINSINNDIATVKVGFLRWV